MKLSKKPWSWWKQWWLLQLLLALFPKTMKEFEGEVLTEALHPEFGWYHREGTK